MKSTKRIVLEAGVLVGLAVLLAFSASNPSPSDSSASKSTLSLDSKPKQDPAKQIRASLSVDARASAASRSKQASLSIYKPAKAYSALTLYPISGTAQVLLLAMDGSVVHQWNVDADRARLLPNCNLLVVHGSKWGGKVEPWKSLRRTVREYDWEGKVKWEFKAPDVAHHDIRRLDNSNTVFLHKYMVPESLKRPMQDSVRKSLPITSDTILEISRSGEKVWQWEAHRHLNLDSCGRRKCEPFVKIGGGRKRVRDWTHMNTVSILPQNKWYEAGDKRFKPGNILTLPRNWWTVFLIDYDSKDVVWEYFGDYRGGLMRGHEAHMIEKGLPGAGNILVFDNGISRKRDSIILEIDPLTKQVVWSYEAEQGFFSRAAGSAQRLPNGNTFISDDIIGRSFEVNKEKEIVWEYRGAHRTSRAQRYSFNYCPKLAQYE